MLMASSSTPPRQSRTVALTLTVLTGVAATAIAYLGTREGVEAPAAPAAAAQPAPRAVTAIALPDDEPDLPPGPHQKTFAVACTICHSTRLVMTQPSFPRKQWTEVVHKMVKTYGAPITADEEARVVDYLVAVRGK